MKKKTNIKLGIKNEADINREFVDVWKRALQGKVKKTGERLYFLDAKTLLKVLSNQRLALLHVLHQNGDVSIRQLSKILSRDYRNVYDDVQLLMDAGLILQKGESVIGTPWDKIQAEIDLAA